MDRIVKQQILNDCNNYHFDVNALNEFVKNGDITIDEFIQHNLEISKVKELKRLKDEREGTAEPLIPETPVKEEVPPFSHENSWAEEPANPSLIEQLKSKHAFDIQDDIDRKLYSYDDLLNSGISKKVVTALKYGKKIRPQISYTIDQLPPMQEGRTDLFFIGVPAAGKTLMLGGLLKYANKKGIMIPDSYNNAGNVFQADLIQDLDIGYLPKRTTIGSYNYVAASIQDSDGVSHPFNIVEVPGENYERLFKEGTSSPTEYITSFMRYIKNKNKKILIFVIDSIVHEERFEDANLGTLDQSMAYVNILNMFKDNGVLEQTDAIYLVANKFDALKNSRYLFSSESEEVLAKDFLDNEFKNLINNCIHARDNSKNKFKIKIFPFSIGQVVYKDILEEYNESYSENIVRNLLQDSFVIKGGRFWKNMF